MTVSVPQAHERLNYPWRFRLGDHVYIRGRGLSETFVVVAGELWLSCPHLTVVDADGRAWRVAQIECSAKPITFRKG